MKINLVSFHFLPSYFSFSRIITKCDKDIIYSTSYGYKKYINFKVG